MSYVYLMIHVYSKIADASQILHVKIISKKEEIFWVVRYPLFKYVTEPKGMMDWHNTIILNRTTSLQPQHSLYYFWLKTS